LFAGCSPSIRRKNIDSAIITERLLDISDNVEDAAVPVEQSWEIATNIVEILKLSGLEDTLKSVTDIAGDIASSVFPAWLEFGKILWLPSPCSFI
jgi:hypothetical protein